MILRSQRNAPYSDFVCYVWFIFKMVYRKKRWVHLGMIDLNSKQAKEVLTVFFLWSWNNLIRPHKILWYENIEVIFKIPRFFRLETQTTAKHLFMLWSLDKLNVVGFLFFLQYEPMSNLIPFIVVKIWLQNIKPLMSVWSVLLY